MIFNFNFRCFEYDVNTFDPFLNTKHFHECILKIIKLFLEDSNKVANELCSEMVSLLVVANLGNYNILQQVLPFMIQKFVLKCF